MFSLTGISTRPYRHQPSHYRLATNFVFQPQKFLQSRDSDHHDDCELPARWAHGLVGVDIEGLCRPRSVTNMFMHFQMTLCREELLIRDDTDEE